MLDKTLDHLHVGFQISRQKNYLSSRCLIYPGESSTQSQSWLRYSSSFWFVFYQHAMRWKGFEWSTEGTSLRVRYVGIGVAGRYRGTLFARKVIVFFIPKVWHSDFEKFEFRNSKSDRFVALILISLASLQMEYRYSFVVWIRVDIYHSMKGWLCTGSLIEPNLVVTAAHCFCFDKEAIQFVWVR